MQTRPDARELLREVARVLKTEFLPAASDGEQYTLRMMLNALSIAGRQIEDQAEADEREYIQLSALLDREDDLPGLERELARRVRAGDVDDDEGLKALLWQLCWRQVVESAPRYLRQEGLTREQAKKSPE